jgi:sporulation protein YlmC with PRC-barrel domain
MSLRPPMTPTRMVAFACLTMLCAAAPLAAQQKESDESAKQRPIVPIEGVDAAALGKSARASKLIGSTVYNGDVSVGQFEDVLFDLDHATVTGVILSVGGFLGIGDKRVAIPINQIQVSNEARFTTGLTRDQLANAPAFETGQPR